jgi:rubrerythrin
MIRSSSQLRTGKEVFMRIFEALSRLESVESKMAEFYEWLSEVFETDADASGLFFRMSLQERSHARLLRYGRKLVSRSPQDFDDVDFDAASVDALLAEVEDFRGRSPEPSLGEALFFAMKTECHPAENAHREVLAVSNPEIGQIIRSLAIADEEHHQTLKSFAQQRAAVFE